MIDKLCPTFTIKSAKKVIDPYTFCPMVQCDILFPITSNSDGSLGLTENTMIKQFYEKFRNDLTKAIEEDQNIISIVQLIPEELDHSTYDYGKDVKTDTIKIPYYWIDMYQMTMPVARTIEGVQIEAYTVKCDVSFSKKDFYDLIYETTDKTYLRNLLKEQFALLREEGYRYFYTGSFQRTVNPETGHYEYKLLMRVAK